MKNFFTEQCHPSELDNKILLILSLLSLLSVFQFNVRSIGILPVDKNSPPENNQIVYPDAQKHLAQLPNPFLGSSYTKNLPRNDNPQNLLEKFTAPLNNNNWQNRVTLRLKPLLPYLEPNTQYGFISEAPEEHFLSFPAWESFHFTQMYCAPVVVSWGTNYNKVIAFFADEISLEVLKEKKLKVDLLIDKGLAICSHDKQQSSNTNVPPDSLITQQFIQTKITKNKSSSLLFLQKAFIAIMIFLMTMVAGFWVLKAALPFKTLSWQDGSFPIYISIGSGLGVGGVSTIYFLFNLAGISSFIVSLMIPITLTTIAIVYFKRITQKSSAYLLPPADSPETPKPTFYGPGIAIILVLIAVSALMIVSYFTFFNPYGGWDALKCWNLKPRILYSYPGDIKLLAQFSVPDYPLLLPGITAWGWSLIRSTDMIIPQILGVIFMGNILLLCFGACLYFTKNTTLAMAAPIALLGTPEFIVHGGMRQYADMPLTFYFLACIVYTVLLLKEVFPVNNSPEKKQLLAPVFPWILCGLLGGMAVWTKHEGTGFAAIYLFSSVFIFIRALRCGLTTSIKNCSFILLGIIPFYLLKKLIAITVNYQHFLQMKFQQDIFYSLTTALTTIWHPFITFGNWGIFYLPVILVFWVILSNCTAKNKDMTIETTQSTKCLLYYGWMTIFGLLSACLLIYTVLDPGMDRIEYIRSTWWRVLLQLWPLFVLLTLVMSGNSCKVRKEQRGRKRNAIFS